MMVSAVNISTDAKSKSWRPKISDKAAMKG